MTYPKENGKVKPYRATYENGTGKPSFDQFAHLPAPRERSKSPQATGSANTPAKGSQSTLAERIAKKKSMEPKRCLPMMNAGNCPGGDKCKLARHHGKTKEQYEAQWKKWKEEFDLVPKQWAVGDVVPDTAVTANSGATSSVKDWADAVVEPVGTDVCPNLWVSSALPLTHDATSYALTVTTNPSYPRHRIIPPLA